MFMLFVNENDLRKMYFWATGMATTIFHVVVRINSWKFAGVEDLRSF